MRVECNLHNVLAAADCEQDEKRVESVAVEPVAAVEYCLPWQWNPMECTQLKVKVYSEEHHDKTL